eukprot:CAMPEP_0119347442 /NCGR_PEP_ID=MMETSP1333-20130426/108527_1 /TAXON_ID=418940 /ORGANISM="Scyphosphaera apsteinii, Strain RCC1455" /LENGTH=672 /DNA_ID=CAMNT_0007359989 /DNA_START=81 /DNA_END=2098 /DNA_ORIENTATION=-
MRCKGPGNDTYLLRTRTARFDRHVAWVGDTFWSLHHPSRPFIKLQRRRLRQSPATTVNPTATQLQIVSSMGASDLNSDALQCKACEPAEVTPMRCTSVGPQLYGDAPSEYVAPVAAASSLGKDVDETSDAVRHLPRLTDPPFPLDSLRAAISRQRAQLKHDDSSHTPPTEEKAPVAEASGTAVTAKAVAEAAAAEAEAAAAKVASAEAAAAEAAATEAAKEVEAAAAAEAVAKAAAEEAQEQRIEIAVQERLAIRLAEEQLRLDEQLEQRVAAKLQGELAAQQAALEELLRAKIEAELRPRLHAELVAQLEVKVKRRLEEEAKVRLDEAHEHRIEQLHALAARRLGQIGLARSWSAWLNAYALRQRRQRVMRAAGSRLMRPLLLAAFTQWNHDWMIAARDAAKVEARERAEAAFRQAEQAALADLANARAEARAAHVTSEERMTAQGRAEAAAMEARVAQARAEVAAAQARGAQEQAETQAAQARAEAQQTLDEATASIAEARTQAAKATLMQKDAEARAESALEMQRAAESEAKAAREETSAAGLAHEHEKLALLASHRDAREKVESSEQEFRRLLMEAERARDDAQASAETAAARLRAQHEHELAQLRRECRKAAYSADSEAMERASLEQQIGLQAEELGDVKDALHLSRARFAVAREKLAAVHKELHAV